jgi:hypothetical protein
VLSGDGISYLSGKKWGRGDNYRSRRGRVPKITVFWDVRPCNVVSVQLRFERTCFLHLQGRREGVVGRIAY